MNPGQPAVALRVCDSKIKTEAGPDGPRVLKLRREVFLPATFSSLTALETGPWGLPPARRTRQRPPGSDSLFISEPARWIANLRWSSRKCCCCSGETGKSWVRGSDAANRRRRGDGFLRAGGFLPNAARRWRLARCGAAVASCPVRRGGGFLPGAARRWLRCHL